jgi:hypothetical protein
MRRAPVSRATINATLLLMLDFVVLILFSFRFLILLPLTCSDPRVNTRLTEDANE